LVEHELGEVVDVLAASASSRRSRSLVLVLAQQAPDRAANRSLSRCAVGPVNREVFSDAFYEVSRDVGKLCGLSQEALVDAIEVHVTHIGGLERGVRNPSHATLLRVAAALRVEPGQLVIEADRLPEAAREPS
jgi:DNA-binding XRE family transcriptional regulator